MVNVNYLSSLMNFICLSVLVIRLIEFLLYFLLKLKIRNIVTGFKNRFFNREIVCVIYGKHTR